VTSSRRISVSANSDAHAAEREKWRNFLRVRPPDIVAPGPGQESVWDPRPPRVEPVVVRVRVEFGGRVLAFSPRRMDACYVGDQRVTPQPGFYYGGWVTPDLVGPFKGAPGSEAW
jgi:hypothetical protein